MLGRMDHSWIWWHILLSHDRLSPRHVQEYPRRELRSVRSWKLFRRLEFCRVYPMRIGEILFATRIIIMLPSMWNGVFLDNGWGKRFLLRHVYDMPAKFHGLRGEHISRRLYVCSRFLCVCVRARACACACVCEACVRSVCGKNNTHHLSL